MDKQATPTKKAQEARKIVEELRAESGVLKGVAGARHAHRARQDFECLADQALVQHEFEMWHKRLVPEDMRDSVDLEAYVGTLAAKTSYSGLIIERSLLAMDLLVHDLPTVWAVQQRSWPLSMDYLLTIAGAFDKLTAEQKTKVDPFIAYLITAKYEGEVLPGPRKLRELVDDVIHTVLDLPLLPRIKKRKVTSSKEEGGNSRTTMVTDDITCAVLEAAIDNVCNASKEPITRAEALRRIIQERVDVKVRINAIRASNEAGGCGPVMMPGVGFVPEADIEAWAEKIVEGKDISHVQYSETNAYQFTRAQKDYISARDETCRFPGCSVRGSLCDVDHAHNYACDENGKSVGGPTSPTNGLRLCRKHHNMKTSGVFSYILFNHGVAVFILPDGSTVTSLPTGYRRMRMRTVSNIRAHRLKKYQEQLEAERQEVLEEEASQEQVRDMTVALVGRVLGEPDQPDDFYDATHQQWRTLSFDDYPHEPPD